MVFDTSEYDFGTVRSDDNIVFYNFTFTNSGKKPMVVVEAETESDCTRVSWPMRPVPPGGKGVVKVTINPHCKPGIFSDRVTVSTDVRRKPWVLSVRGIVEERIVFATDMGTTGLEITPRHLAFNSLRKDEQGVREAEIFNKYDRTIRIKIGDVPTHLETSNSTIILEPNQKESIAITYHPERQSQVGLVVDELVLSVEPLEYRDTSLVISALIIDDETALPKNAYIVFNAPVFEFGTIHQNERVEHEFVFANVGRADLFIKRVTSSCGCTVASPRDIAIPSGSTSSISAVFNPGTNLGSQTRLIKVVTNDPENPQFILEITGSVESDN